MEFKKFLDQILSLARENIRDEVGGLLGTEFELGRPELELTTLPEFRSGLLKKYACAALEVQGQGGQSGTSMMACSVRDAILMGGTLLMIPESELKKNIQQEYFSPDEMDAYGEIANITSGILTTLFSRFHPDKPRFTKSDIEIMEPDGPPLEDNAPLVRIRYPLRLSDRELDPLELLLPASPLGLLKEQEGREWPRSPEKPESNDSKPAGKESAKEDRGNVDQEEADRKPADILILHETPTGAAPFEQALHEQAFSLACHSFQDNFRKHVQTETLKGVLVIMDQVSERGLAAVIKARASAPDTAPILAAGPQWTRRTVLQAAKYGVRDIIVTPAEKEELLKKFLMFTPS
ncbi:MAG TPA: hypothetical protein VJ934_08265 [Desulfomicrobiaceae bacterium]|nr:hypothetical protein [Desulfomicrobiaceae bacterium]